MVSKKFELLHHSINFESPNTPYISVEVLKNMVTVAGQVIAHIDIFIMGPGNETSFEKTGTAEIVAENSTSEKIKEMLKLIVKFKLRKSLAWDSAFFTGDGVLDVDELSTMIEGGEKGFKHQFRSRNWTNNS